MSKHKLKIIIIKDQWERERERERERIQSDCRGSTFMFNTKMYSTHEEILKRWEKTEGMPIVEGFSFQWNKRFERRVLLLCVCNINQT